MSTKTSFKRIAAVAAVALTLGGFSAVSANAAPTADTLAVSSSAVAATSSVKSQVAVTQTFLAQASGDAGTITAALISAPATNIAVPTFETATVTGYTDASATRATSGGASMTTTVSGSTFPAYVAATYNLNFTPVVSGTYIVKLIPTLANGGTAATAYATAQTITYTVAAKPAITAAGSTVLNNYSYYGKYPNDGSTWTTWSTTTDTAGASCYDNYIGASGHASCAEIQVVEGNGSTTAAMVAADAVPLTVTVSGPALASVNANGDSYNATIIPGAVYIETTAQNTSLTKYVYVYATGTPGVATVTISAGTTVLATKTVTFYHTAASITPTVVTPLFGATTATGAITAVVKDASGTPVQGTHVYAVSDNTAAVSNSYTDCGVSSIAGAVSCNLVGVAAGTANIQLTLNSSSTGTSTVSATPVAVRVGSSSAASVKWSLDAASYVPGSLVTASVTLLDAAGLPVAPGLYAGVFAAPPTFSLAPATGAGMGTDVTVAAGSSTGTVTYTFNAPLAAGSLVIKATTGAALATANQGVAVSLTADISGGAGVDAAQAAQDAANEATDAANAATDAANNAMDSADAAQQAAMDAGDKADAALAAVTDLATKVSEIATQIQSLSAVVAKIAAAVAKISAKVKA